MEIERIKTIEEIEDELAGRKGSLLGPQPYCPQVSKGGTNMKYQLGNYNRLLVGNLYDFDQNLPQEIKERLNTLEVSS